METSLKYCTNTYKQYLINNILAYLCMFSVSQINSNHGKMWIKREIKVNNKYLNMKGRLNVRDNRPGTVFQFIYKTKCTQFKELPPARA